VLQSLTYAHDASDVITKITNGVNAGLTQAHDYNELSRLTSMTGSAERGQVHLSSSFSDRDGSNQGEGG
jgi:hypothetical protein